jgi:diguanylate cyclase (GGDEF)-like protein
VGDKVLVKVAEALKRSFRATDYACRIGGDEFAVVLMGLRGEMRAVVERKLKKISAELADTSDGLPKVTLSIGVAFGSQLPENTNLYHAADTALYEAKHRGRNRYVFYNGELT